MMRPLFFILLSLCFIHEKPLQAMQKKKNCCSLTCSPRTLRLCSAVCAGLLCTTIGLGAHQTIINNTKADHQKEIARINFEYENPCLEVSVTHQAFAGSTLTLNPPLCDPYFDTDILEEIFNERFGRGTQLTSRRVPCTSSTTDYGPSRVIRFSCTADPEKAAQLSADIYYGKKPKTD